MISHLKEAFLNTPANVFSVASSARFKQDKNHSSHAAMSIPCSAASVFF